MRKIDDSDLFVKSFESTIEINNPEKITLKNVFQSALWNVWCFYFKKDWILLTFYYYNLYSHQY